MGYLCFMQKKTIGKIFKWIKIIAIIYVAIGLALFFLQEKLIFHPKKLSADHVYNFPGPFREINLAVTNEKVLGIVQFTVPDSVRKGVVLYFHGNRQNIERYAPFAKNFTSNNYEVWMIDYPGYGKSTGDRTEEIMYSDALLFYKMATAVFSKDSIIIYGKSLGTGVAAKLASIRDCKRLILETPFYSFDALINRFAFIYPAGPFTKFHFPINEYLERIAAPITIFHGTSDWVIPYHNASRLKKLLKPSDQFITIEGGSHNNLTDFPLFHQKLDSLLN